MRKFSFHVEDARQSAPLVELVLSESEISAAAMAKRRLDEFTHYLSITVHEDGNPPFLIERDGTTKSGDTASPTMITELPHSTRASRRRRPFRWPVMATVFLIVGIVGIAVVVAIR